MEKYAGAREAINDNIIWRMRFACWITNAVYTHSEDVKLIVFTSTVLLLTHLGVTLFAHCLPCPQCFQADAGI